MSDEKGHLDALLKHPGWLLFLIEAKQQWGPAGYGRKVQTAIAQAKRDKTDVTLAVSEVDAAVKAVNDILGWPAHALKMIEDQEQREAAGPSLRRA